MKLFENWNQNKEQLLDGLTADKAKLVAPLMENQKQYITETAAVETTNTGAIQNFLNITIPMIRRIIPGTIASEVVGVQPMSGPVGLAYSMRFKYAEAFNTGNAATNIAAGDEAFGFNGKTHKFYAGGQVDDGSGTMVGTGEGGATSELEAFGGRQMQLEILKQTVTAKSRKLQAKWTIEAMQDLNASHGLDLEKEITTALSAEIVSEIDREIIDDLAVLAGTVENFDMSTTTGTPHYVGDKHAALGVLVNKVANEIARKTRRGAANFAIVSPLVASVLQSGSKSVFAPAIEGSFEGPSNTKLIGTLNGTIKIYTYVYHDTGAEPMILGYKGGNGEIDTGYFYCPYVPLMTSDVITDPQTYNLQVGLMTRYGKATFTDTSTSLGHSANYYGRIEVSNLTFV